MMERLQNILKEAKEKLALVQTQNELNETRAYYMGKKSPLGEILKQMGPSIACFIAFHGS